jgi:hypothetical protein
MTVLISIHDALILYYMQCSIFTDHEFCWQLNWSTINRQMHNFFKKRCNLIRKFCLPFSCVTYFHSCHYQDFLPSLKALVLILHTSTSSINVSGNFICFHLPQCGVLYHSLCLCHLLRPYVIWDNTNSKDRTFRSEFHFDGSVKFLLFPLLYFQYSLPQDCITQ